MFRQRLLTTLVLVPLVIAAIYFAPAWILAGIVVAVLLISAWEWTKLVPIQSLEGRLVYLLCLLGLVWVCEQWILPSLWLGLLVWFGILLAIVTYPYSQSYWGFRPLVGGLGLFLLSLFAIAQVGIYQYPLGQDLILYALSLIWAVDIGAYLTGKRLGRRKLIARVSPGKTLEGAAGGFCLAMIVAMVGKAWFNPQSPLSWFLVAIGMILISMVGDLFISMLKRREHVKDSGHILPGHGGILDRLDSSIAALPFFYFSLAYLEFWR